MDSDDPEFEGREAEVAGGGAAAFLLRLVPESELRATGRATPTGIHLALFGPECTGLDAWDLGELWGYSPPELQAMRHAGDHLVAVLQAPGPRWGRVTAETLAALVVRLRPEVAGNADVAVLTRALRSTAAEAEVNGLRRVQRRLSIVLGLRDGVFGTDRLPSRDAPGGAFGFCIDEKLLDGAPNGLEPGSSLAVEDYPGAPVVRRLSWEDAS